MGNQLIGKWREEGIAKNADIWNKNGDMLFCVALQDMHDGNTYLYP